MKIGKKYSKCLIGYQAFKKAHLKGTPSKDFLEDKNFLRAFLLKRVQVNSPAKQIHQALCTSLKKGTWHKDFHYNML